MEPKVFFAKLYPYAVQVAQLLGLPEAAIVPVTLAQWAHESGWEAPNWVGGNNYSGITDGGPPNFLRYPTIADFARDHVRVLQLSYFAQVRAAAAAGCAAETVAVLLGVSPWDAGRYMPADGDHAGVPGGYLVRIFRAYDLANYTPGDALQPAAVPEPQGPVVPQPATTAEQPESTSQQQTANAESVAVSDWATAAAKWVVDHGISDGTRPKEAATREELWEMLRRAFTGQH